MSDAVILLDTNVVSELMRPKPAPAILDWFAAQDSAKLLFSAVSEAELRTSAAILPAGKRRDSLISAIEIMITTAIRAHSDKTCPNALESYLNACSFPKTASHFSGTCPRL